MRRFDQISFAGNTPSSRIGSTSSSIILGFWMNMVSRCCVPCLIILSRHPWNYWRAKYVYLYTEHKTTFKEIFWIHLQGYPLLNGINWRIRAINEAGLIHFWTSDIIKTHNNYAKVFFYSSFSRISEIKEELFMCHSWICEVARNMPHSPGSILKGLSLC